MIQNILYYISGHGYGHAVRSAEVIFAIAEKSPQTQIHIKTSAPSWLFTYKNYPQIQVYPDEFDVGAVQKNSFQVDIQETYHKVQQLFGSWDTIFEQESAFVQSNKIDLIVGDIPPLAFRLAFRLNIPCYAIGNFGWDWIYQDWVNSYPQFSDIVNEIQDDYSKVDLLFQLPTSESMDVFPNKIESPLIARLGDLSKTEFVQKYHLPVHKKWMLLALPQYDRIHIPWEKIIQNNEWIFLSPFHDEPQNNIFPIPREGFRFSDLVGVSDIVLSKPGYGIVSDCFANRVPLLYIERDDFIECAVITQWLSENSIASELTFDKFISGDWEEALSFLCNDENQWSDLSLDGDQFIADYILFEKF